MWPRRSLGSLPRRAFRWLWPDQKLKWTREGLYYLGIWVALLTVGLYQQLNMILLIAGLAAGPLAASVVVSGSVLGKQRVARRVPRFSFAGDPLSIDYTLHNDRGWTAALAMTVEDEIVPADRLVSGSIEARPHSFFARVPARESARNRWQTTSPRRGRYHLTHLELVTRAPFGLLERRLWLSRQDALTVYPEIGELTRRWHNLQREATEMRRGHRHDRSIQQQEYHGLRDYRPGDSPRWIHWRTSARVGKPMVKEFEVQQEQDLVLLIDPWLPRSKATAEQRELVEQVIRFAATVSLEVCRHQGSRFAVGWTGPHPGLCGGPASVKLLHEVLEQLAVLRPSSEGHMSALFDIIAPAMLRDAVIVLATTRTLHLAEEAEKSKRLASISSRGVISRMLVIDSSRGDLNDLFRLGRHEHANTRGRRPAGGSPNPVVDSADRASTSTQTAGATTTSTTIADDGNPSPPTARR